MKAQREAKHLKAAFLPPTGEVHGKLQYLACWPSAQIRCRNGGYEVEGPAKPKKSADLPLITATDTQSPGISSAAVGAAGPAVLGGARPVTRIGARRFRHTGPGRSLTGGSHLTF